MTESQSKELDAFLAFFTTFNLHRPITAATDLSDGAGLFEILSTMCGPLPNLTIASDP
jgi:protein HOOK3